MKITCGVCGTETKINNTISVVDFIKKINWGIMAFEYKQEKINSFFCESCSEEFLERYKSEVV